MKPTIKYLLNGEYHYATVKDIGDIEKLKTAVKTDLVGAINSVIGMGGAIPEDLLERLNQFENDIDGIMSSGFNDTQLNQLQAEITAVQERITADLEARVAVIEKNYNDRLDTVTEDYDAKVVEINNDLVNIKTNIETAEASLEETGEKLSAVELNVTEVTKSVDTINGKLESKIDSTEFDLLESTVKDNETSIEQNKKDIALKASQESLDLATGRITDAEAKIEVNAQGITSSVKRDELRKELDGINIYGANLLRNTRDWEGWKANVPARAYRLTETYNHLHIQEQLGSGNYLEDDVLELEVGKTYTASVWGKSSSQSAKAILRVGSVQHEMKNQNGDVYLNSSWQRMAFSFVANSPQTKVAFTVSNVANSVSTQFAGGKLESGIEHTGWQANEEDVYERVVSAEATVKQQADSITALVEKQTKIGDDVTSQRTEINQMSESIGLHASKLEEIDGEVSQQKASIELNAGNILSKVEQSDIDKSIEGISLDRRNLILNSDFILDMSDWSNVNENFRVIENNGKKSLTISRSGLSSNMVASASSNLFEAKSGDKLSIGLDVTVADLAKFDNKTVAVLDLFDIRDTRVAFEEFTLDKLDGELSNGTTGRLTTRYVIDREDVAKARLRLTLYRNGNITFTNITIEKGDIKSIGWSPAPEDSQLVQANLKTMIDQNAESISLKAESDTVDKLTGRLETNEAELKIANDAITANIDKLTNVDGTLEEHSAQITATAQELSSKMTSTQVDEMLDEKKFATQSELKQTSEGFTTTVSSITSQVEALDKEVKDTKYTWIMWADDIQGNGISENSNGKKFMGVAYNKPTINGSKNPSDYVWSKAVGEDGSSGVSVSSIVSEYRVTTSSTTVPTSGWTTTIPSRKAGQYLWVREKVTYSNNSSEYVGSRVVTGDAGDKGSNGISITSVVAQFAVNTSKTGAPTTGWSSTQPTRNNGQYLWRRDLITYSDTSTSLTTAVVVTGDKGDAGQNAQLLYLTSDVETMTFTASNVADPSSQVATIMAKLQNISGTLTFTAKALNGTTALSNTITLSGTGNSRTLNVSAFPATATHIEVTATIGSLSDTISIFKLKHGAKGSGGSAGKDALVGFLTNESITLGANSSGVVASFATATGSFRVFEGLTDVSSSATYSVASSTGATVAISSAGIYTVTAMSTDDATAELKAVYKGAEIVKTLSLAKSKTGAKGAKGDTGEAGGDAYTVVLSNESHAFAGDDKKAIATSIPVSVIAYKGATKVASTIGTITGHATGLTTSISGNGTLNNTFTVSATTALTTRDGVLTIPITVDGQTFTKTFSFTLALKGTAGVKGDSGANAQLINLSASGQIFAKSKTGSITPATISVTGAVQNTTIATWQYSVDGGSFTTSLPTGVTRSGNTVTLTGSTVTAKTIAIKALNGSVEDVITIAKVEDGDKGDKGDKGEDGKDGVAGDSGLSVMLLNESQTIATRSDRTATLAQTINIPFTAYLGSSQISCTATLGDLPNGVTVKTNTAGTATKDGLIVLEVASRANLGGTSTAFDAGVIDINITANGKTVRRPFSWSKTIAGQTARTFFVEPSVSVIVRNPDGSYTPSSIVFSSFYKDGTSSAKTAYARYWRVETTLNGEIWTELATQNTTSTTYTVSSLPKDITGIRATTYSNSALTTAHDTQSVMVVSNGIAVDSIDVQYYLSTSSTSLSGGSWSTTAPAWVNGRFMWSKTVTVLSDGGVSESKPVCITGQKGSTGSTGATGKGVSSITEEYAMNTSKTTVPTTWSTTVPTWSKGKYLWTRSKIVYTNPAGTDYTTPYVDTSWEAVNVLEASVNKSIGTLDTSLKTLKDNTLPALEDGLLNKSEKEAVRQSLNVTKSDKSGIDSQYTAVYGNSSLSGTPKTNLYNAKVAYNTAYGNLEVAIDTVLGVADGTRITTAQYSNVQTRFTNYQSSLATLRQRFEEALDAISGKKVKDVNDELVKVTTRVTNAEQKITDDKIVSTVTSSTTFKNVASDASSAKTTLGSKASTWDAKASTGYVDGKASTAETNAKTHAETLDAVQALAGNSKKFINPASYRSSSSSLTGYLIIRTPILSSFMTRLKISGYNYQTNNTDISLDVGFYAYTSSSIVQTSYVSHGDFSINKVQMARDSSGRAVVIIGEANTQYKYPNIVVDEAIIGHNTPPDSYKDGWSMSVSTSLSGLSDIVNVAGSDTQKAIGDVVSRVSTAEQKITDSAIVSTVTSHSTFKDTQSKANSAKSTLDSKSGTWDAKATTGYVDGKAGTAETNAKDYAKKQVDDMEIGGRNLIVEYTVEKGGYLNNQNSWTSSASWVTSDFIEAVGSQTYITSGHRNLGNAPAICFYNSSRGFISGIGGSQGRVTVKTPSNTAFIRISFEANDIGIIKLEKGNKATAYARSPEDEAYLASQLSAQQLVPNQPLHNSGGAMHNNNHGLYFEVTEDVLIGKTMINSGYSGSLVVQLREGHSVTGAIVEEKTFTVKSGVQWLDLNFLLRKNRNTKYTLLAPPRSGDLYRTSFSGYPVNAGSFKVTGAVASGYWYYFYNIHVAGIGVVGEEYFNNNLTDVTERLSSAELKITDSAITSTVTQSTTYKNAMGKLVEKDKIASTINQTAQDVTINASKINLNGAVTISAFNSGLKSDFDAKATRTQAQGYATTAEENAVAYVDANTGNLVNNPAVTGNHTGWSASGLSSVNRAFEGVTTRMLQSSVSSDTQNYSSYFKVDPSKAYEVSVWISKSANGSYYLGLNGLSSSGSTVGFVQVNNSGNVSSSNNTNFYFQNGSVSTSWLKIVGYIMPVGTDPKDLAGVGTASNNAIMKQNIDRIRVRFLNWGNGGTTRQMWVANPKVVEVDPNAVIYGAKGILSANIADGKAVSAQSTANNAKSKTDAWSWNNTTKINGGQIQTKTIRAEDIQANSVSAMSANLGTVTAGIIRSEESSNKYTELNLNNGIYESMGKYEAPAVSIGGAGGTLPTDSKVTIKDGTFRSEIVETSNTRYAELGSGEIVASSDKSDLQISSLTGRGLHVWDGVISTSTDTGNYGADSASFIRFSGGKPIRSTHFGVNGIRIENNSGSSTPAIQVVGNAGDHLIRTRGIDGANSNGTIGDLYLNYNNQGGTVYIHSTTKVHGRANMMQLHSTDTNGHGYYSWFNSAGSRVGYIGFPSSNHNLFEIRNDQSDGDIRLSAPNGNVSVNGTNIVSSGSNSNGLWVRFYDGTQICMHYANAQYQSTSRMDYAWTYPQRFVDNVIRASTTRSAANITSAVNSCAPSITTSTTYDAVIRYWAQLDRPFSTNSVTNFAIHMIAIGRWK